MLGYDSAARLWGFWRRPDRCSHVVTSIQRMSRSQTRIHFSRRLHAADVTMLRGIPVTTVARTIVDLAEQIEPAPLANAMYEAAYLGLLVPHEVLKVIGRLPGRRGARVAEAALDAHLAGSAGTRSQLEERFLALIVDAGIPHPLVNMSIHAAGRRIEVDFLWPAQRLCVEIDGVGHRRARARANDEARAALLRSENYVVLRFSSHDVDRRAKHVVAAVRRVLSQVQARG